MTQTAPNEKARAQDGTGQRAGNQERRNNTTSGADGKAILGAHSPLIEPAERAGSALLASVMEWPEALPTIPPAESFPDSQQAVAKAILAAVSNGARGWPEVASTLATSSPALVSEVATIADSGAVGSLALLEPLAKTVRIFATTRTRQRALWKWQTALNQGDEVAQAEAMAELGSEPQTAPDGDSSRPFAFQIADEIGGVAETLDFVESLLTEAGASVVYGGSNTGKSFWALDLGACVATGQPFRGELEVEQGSVVYVCLEGTNGARNRIAALKLAGRLPDSAPLFLCFYPVNLLEVGHADRLAATVAQAAAQSAMPCKLVILDTLARGMSGGDENSGKDMSQAVQSVDRVRALTGAHVMLIHHCGKNESLGARGHSSLRAAMDTEIEVFRPDGETVSTVKITKQRDMPLGEPMPFTLESVTLGTDRRGKPITSCTVRHEDSMMAATRGKVGRKPDVPRVRLLELLPQPSTAAWQKAADSELGVTKSAFYRAKDVLAEEKAARMTRDGKWESLKPL